jgi:hypothetical protein
MTSNPLARRRAEEPSRSLDEHVATLNRMNWVRASGKPYFVGERKLEDGEIQRFVDRTS